MAHRHRDIISAVADRENIHSKAAIKPTLTKQLTLTRRAALAEVDNKLNGVKDPLKRQESLKDPRTKPLLKENVAAKKKETTTQAFSSQQLVRIEDPDANNKDEPQMVAEYVTDIYQYLKELEAKYPIRERFLEGHQSSPRMRTILINWLVQVHANFKLCLETLYLCVAITDRYLQVNAGVGRDTLQLVGAAALMIACKYEEMYMPTIKDFVYICDDTFSEKQILRMEIEILTKLGCNLGRPAPIHFLRRYSKIAQVQMQHHTLSKYILELALLDHNLSPVKPSIQAAAACCLSLSILNEASCASKVWTPTLAHYTGYTYPQFKHVVIKFANMLLMSSEGKNQSVQSKYASSKNNKISTDSRLRGSLVRKLAHSSPKP